jgi:hypothetical protein
MPRDSITLVAEVTPPPTLATFRLTLITNYKQDSPLENNGPLTGLIDLIRSEYPAVSPTSAETILALDPTLNATIRATAFGLATTVREQTAQYAEKLTKADQKIQRLERINQQRQEDNRQLQARLGLLSIPDGFECNQGQVATRVPTNGGQMVVPEWIRPVGDGQMELLAGREPGEPTYITDLFLRPNYTENPTETAAPWFLALLTSQDGGFHTLAEEARHLDNPAAVVEIFRYRKLDEERTQLTTELNRISDTLSATRDHLNGCRHRMEWAQLPGLLSHLEDRNSFQPPIAQLGRRRRNTRRVRVDGGASP